MRSPTAPPARATTRCASSSPPTRSTREIKVIAPWREWDLNSRARLIDYAERRQIPIPRGKSGEPPYSTDANLLHISYEGRALEDPWQEPDDGDVHAHAWRPRRRPMPPTYVEIDFERGDPVAIDGERAVAGRPARAAQRDRRRATASAASIWSRTASSA